MTFAEAIRIGAKRHPQAFGMNVDVSEFGKITATCAKGGASLMLHEEELSRHEWLLSHREAACPKCGCGPRTLWVMIAHLNDVHRVTREWIADWLEPLELAP
jgi:hypothetical protein